MRVPLSVTHRCSFTKGSHVYLVQRWCAVSVVGEWAQAPPSVRHPTCHAFLQTAASAPFLPLAPERCAMCDNREQQIAFQPLLLPLFRLNYSATLLEGLQHHIKNI